MMEDSALEASDLADMTLAIYYPHDLQNRDIHLFGLFFPADMRAGGKYECRFLYLGPGVENLIASEEAESMQLRVENPDAFMSDAQYADYLSKRPIPEQKLYYMKHDDFEEDPGLMYHWIDKEELFKEILPALVFGFTENMKENDVLGVLEYKGNKDLFFYDFCEVAVWKLVRGDVIYR